MFYTGIQSILNDSLGQYYYRDFALMEKDGHLVLYRRGEQVATMTITASHIMIRAVCELAEGLVGKGQ